MNKKNRYIQHTNKEKINSLELHFLFYAAGPNPEALYRRHKTEFLRLWKEHCPGTRPKIFWMIEHPESYQRLFDAEMNRIRAEGSCVFSGIDLMDANNELIRLDELDPDELEAEPKALCFRDLKAAYLGG